jgi:hypothetical protein
MDKLLKYSGLVALVILAIMTVPHLFKGQSFGTAISCATDVTCFTKLGVLTTFQVDGTTIFNGTVTYTSSIVAAALSATTATFSGLVTHDAGVLESYANATTTSLSTTLKASDFTGYNSILVTPIVGNITLTFPASSTVSTFLPAAGDMQRTCFENSTTTAGVYITLAGGTGFDLQVASSSTTALGSTVIGPQKVGCVNFVRGKATATTFDIHAALSSYQ